MEKLGERNPRSFRRTEQGSREICEVHVCASGRQGEVWYRLEYRGLMAHFVSEEHRGQQSTVLYFPHPPPQLETWREDRRR